MNTQPTTKGFTLIELMITITLMAIMFTIAWPNMRTFVAKTRVINRAQQVANLFRYAKGEAIRINTPIVICGDTIRSDGRANGACTANIFSAGSNDSKKSALKAFADINRNGQYNASGSNPDIDVRTIALNGNNKNPVIHIDLQYCGIASKCVSASNPKQLIFMPNGKFGTQTKNAKLAANLSRQSVIFTISDAQAKGKDPIYRRYVKVSPSGQVDVCSAKNGTSQVRNINNLDCNN